MYVQSRAYTDTATDNVHEANICKYLLIYYLGYLPMEHKIKAYILNSKLLNVNFQQLLYCCNAEPTIFFLLINHKRLEMA